MAQTVKDVMATNIVSCDPTTPLAEAARLMRDQNIGDVLVVENDRLSGIVTDRDIVVRCVAERPDLSDAKLSDAVSGDVTTVEPDTTINEATQIMRELAIRRLPVVENGKPVGVVTIGELAMERDPSSALADISAAAPNT
jgi:CBS domain-containing protein